MRKAATDLYHKRKFVRAIIFFLDASRIRFPILYLVKLLASDYVHVGFNNFPRCDNRFVAQKHRDL